MQATITESPFQLPDGREATLYTLTNANGMIAKISNLGGVITELHVPDRDGVLADVCHGYDNVDAYLGKSEYFGALIGRYGNRIANGRFTLDGVTYQLDVNDGINHLHGGADGFHRQLWEAETFNTPQSVGLILTYLSIDGDQGYPGTAEITTIYELRNNNELRIAFHAVTDKATPMNLTNHAYFNLAGQGISSATS
jgi:aldose 1-epimerase